ncbi:MAG: hypothetical protein JW795_07460 [Chitinivibrionales bacterium]|nr:hypothetical protein [Chitinivibrionales bacterium]
MFFRMVSFLVALCTVLPYATVTVSVPTPNVLDVSGRGIATFATDIVGGQPGQPALPVYRTSLLLPANADLNTVTFSLEGLTEKLAAENIDVDPMQVPKPANYVSKSWWAEGGELVNGRDLSVYSTDAVYPADNIKVLDVGELYAFKIVTVEVFLYRYNPVKKKLFQLTAANLKVDYATEAEFRNDRSIKIPARVVQEARRKVANFDEFIANYDASYTLGTGNGVVILVPSDMKSQLSNFDAFVASKKAIGFDVTVLTDSDWGGGTGSGAYTNIRKWLQNNYKTKGINYAILIGAVDLSSSKVPMHKFVGYSPNGNGWPGDCESEFGYEQLTGSDYKSDKMCDIAVGRIPAFGGVSEMNSILKRSITHGEEQNPTWRYNALLGGPGFSASALICTEQNRAYASCIQGNAPWKARRIYGTRWGTPSQADVTFGAEDYKVFSGEWVKQAFGVISWGTHGNATLAQDVMKSDLCASIGKQTTPALVLCGSCLNASISTTSNLSYSLLKNSAIAVIAGTRETAVNDDMKWGGAFLGLVVKDSMTVGEALKELNNNHLSYPNDWYNRGPMCIYGDPTLRVYAYKLKTSVSQPTQSLRGSVSLSVIGHSITMNLPTAQKNVVVILFDGHGRAIATHAIDEAAAGMTTIPLSTNLVAGGVYFVKMTSNDYSNLTKILKN